MRRSSDSRIETDAVPQDEILQKEGELKLGRGKAL